MKRRYEILILMLLNSEPLHDVDKEVVRGLIGEPMEEFYLDCGEDKFFSQLEDLELDEADNSR